MKSSSKVTKSLFVIVIAMCLNISVVLPSFAETREKCIKDANSKISDAKFNRRVASFVTLMSLVSLGYGISIDSHVIVAVEGFFATIFGMQVINLNGLQEQYEYRRDNVCPELSEESATNSSQNTTFSHC